MTIKIAINSYKRHVGPLMPAAFIHGIAPAKSMLGRIKLENSTRTLIKAATLAKITGVNNTVNSDNEWGFPLYMIDHGPNMGLIMDLAA